VKSLLFNNIYEYLQPAHHTLVFAAEREMLKEILLRYSLWGKFYQEENG
jgi:hypothetical protein